MAVVANTVPAHAVESVPGETFDSIRAWLLERNPELDAMALEVDAAFERIYPAGALPDPMGMVELRDIDADRPRLLPGQVGATYYQVRQRFPLWGKRQLERDTASAMAETARQHRAGRTLDLLGEAESAYVRYWHVDQAVAEVDRIIAVLNDLDALAQARYAAGLAPQQDAIKAQVERTAMRRERIERLTVRRQTASRLNALLGRAPDAPLATPLERPELHVAATTEVALAAAVERHPAIAAEASTIAAATSREERVRRNRYPDLTIGLAPVQRGTRLHGWEIMVEVDIPLQRRTRRHQESEARLLREAALRRRESVASTLLGEAGEALAHWRGARDQRALIEGTLLAQAEASFRSALAGYQTGAVDFTTVLEALRQWRDAGLAQLDSLRDELLAAARLRALTGDRP
ncbi:MAG TPA: TolC family protein [Xanthomonadaceae bacterium]|nr:TolC family protein [Xanthomonadaceae bacterium]